MSYNYIEKLKRFTDDRGDLLPLNFSMLPFQPKRTFLVTNVPKNIKRGGHAHFSTQQFLLCLKGSIEVELFNGTETTTSLLSEGEGVYVPNKVWDSQVFKTGDDILLVFASTEFDETDYITSKKRFITIVNE